MNTIEYLDTDNPVPVLVERKIVGYIHKRSSQFQYVPKGKKLSQGGDLFDSMDACLRSLETD